MEILWNFKNWGIDPSKKVAVARSYSQERAGRDLKNRPQVESTREKKKGEAENNMEKTAGGRNGTKEDFLDGSGVLRKEEESGGVLSMSHTLHRVTQGKKKKYHAC